MCVRRGLYIRIVAQRGGQQLRERFAVVACGFGGLFQLGLVLERMLDLRLLFACKSPPDHVSRSLLRSSSLWRSQYYSLAFL